MKIVMTFTAMVMAKTSPDEHYSEHYWQYTIDIASGQDNTDAYKINVRKLCYRICTLNA